MSDTHIPQAADELPPVIIEEIKKSDACLHLGDFTEKKLFDLLQQYTELYAVAGNMDDEELMKILPKKRILELAGVTIGLTHGKGRTKNPIADVKNIFSDNYQDIDIFIFGHSHQAVNDKINNKIYFNPGSPTDKIFSAYNSYGILELSKGQISRRIVKLG
jgi:hypothetical protein